MRDGSDHPFFLANRAPDEDANISAVRADYVESIGYPGFAESMRYAVTVGPPNLWLEGDALRVEWRRTDKALDDLFRVYQDLSEGPLEIDWYRLVKHSRA